MALGVEPGQVVVTVSHTAVATVAAIEAVGGVPALVDIDPARMTMDPGHLARALDVIDNVGAVVVVHLYGQPADMSSILPICRAAGVPVIEDSSQAHGAEIDGAHVGTLGDAGAFSCYPTKNLGALGDAGVVIGSEQLCDEIRLLRQYGWRQRYISDISGRNSRLDPIQAAVLRVRLRDLSGMVERRRWVASTYVEALGDVVSLPAPSPSERHAFHQFVVRSASRERILDSLGRHYVPYALLYPLPVHRQPAYDKSPYLPPTGLPVTDQVCRELICLPMHPRLTLEHVEEVAGRLREGLDRGGDVSGSE
jgi:dTDP-4-amino-4,6-dideoxygalactose transaminase